MKEFQHMIKEIDSIITLQERRNRMSLVIEKGNSVIGQKTAVQDSLKEEVGTSFEADMEYVNALRGTKRVVISVGRKNKALDDFDQEIEPEVRKTAIVYLNRVNSLQQYLPQMKELMREGHLSEEDVQPHAIELEELLKLQQPNSLLQRGIDRVKRESGERKGGRPEVIDAEPASQTSPEAHPEQSERESSVIGKETIVIVADSAKIELKRAKSGAYLLENGIEVGPKSLQLLISLSGTSRDYLKGTERLLPEVYPDIGYERALSCLTHLINGTTKSLLENTDVEIGKERIRTGTRGRKVGYYLRSRKATLVDIQTQIEEGFAFEDGKVVEGETGKILSKLSPFGTNHIVSSQELLREIAIGQPVNAQLEEIRPILLTKGLRLAHVPNQNNPEEIAGYYVESYDPNIRMSLLGDTMRYSSESGEKQTRLVEDQWSLLRALHKGEPRSANDLPKSFAVKNPDSQKVFIAQLNKQLADVTGREETVVTFGNQEFGQWYKTKDTSITFMSRYLPVYPSRQEALSLIFRGNSSAKDIIKALGQTSGNRRAARELSIPQARMAFSKALARLENRMSAGISTEEETELHKQMQKYMEEHSLSDREMLKLHIVGKLTDSNALPTSDVPVNGDLDLPEDLDKAENTTADNSNLAIKETTVFEAPTKKLNKRERKEKKMGDELIKYLKFVIEEIENDTLNARQAGEKFTLLKSGVIFKASQGHWISSKTIGGQFVYNPSHLATMMYIQNNNVQDPRSRKKVFGLAKQEYEKMQKKKNGK
jgi:hypothetical protein